MTNAINENKTYIEYLNPYQVKDCMEEICERFSGDYHVEYDYFSNKAFEDVKRILELEPCSVASVVELQTFEDDEPFEWEEFFYSVIYNVKTGEIIAEVDASDLESVKRCHGVIQSTNTIKLVTAPENVKRYEELGYEVCNTLSEHQVQMVSGSVPVEYRVNQDANVDSVKLRKYAHKLFLQKERESKAREVKLNAIFSKEKPRIKSIIENATGYRCSDQDIKHYLYNLNSEFRELCEDKC
ncbi:hypothetical protein [Vibrio parahaemolyticus]|uniref:hypothetical protein n=1 Tax=Vibrio parahaemolyticus TaxID=670 RepID=UPI001EEA77D3|nr:hypothetical protein [Vibrio parahaemolyticus]MCG6440365.1 hypothetical protein [Vibrio parahaemolyticus]MCG6455751.1 hypothetical protein [Vibrio parahaemolyticus]